MCHHIPFALLAVLTLLTANSHAAIVIGSFDGSRSSRPFTGSSYSNIRADLLNPANFGAGGTVNDTVSIAPAISLATGANLSGLDVFVISEVTSLSAAERTALQTFVLNGNCLILVTNSSSASRPGANLMLQTLDGGSVTAPTGGNQGANVGSFVASTSATNGPFGNLVGGTFAASIASTLNAGSSSTVIGRTSGGTFDIMLEIPAGALGPGSGAVLGMSDVLAMDFFVPPATFANNVNNSNFFLNFIAAKSQTAAVPEPTTLTAWSILGTVAVGAYWRRKRKS